MIVSLAYGQGHLPVELPDGLTTVIEPRHLPGLPDEKAAVLQALGNPIAARPLKEWIQPQSRICISFSDITRATPNERLIPWLLEHLSHVPRENITLLNQLGTHRPNTREELERLLTPEVVRHYRVINHEPGNLAIHRQFGTMHDGTPAWINKHCADADVRIVTGFIEPHFFAGFSGGPKGIIPGVAALQTVMSSHDFGNIGHPQSSFGITHGNPLWEELLAVALRVGPSFLVNVSLNPQRQITGVFAGDLVEAHRRGTTFVRDSAMQPQSEPFDIVVTTNSGYPLDMNLYQGVKGMSAGARVLKKGGLLILACECREGVPSGSPMDKLHRSVGSTEELLLQLASGGAPRPEQWQGQIQALVQRHARVQVYSRLPQDVLKACHLEPCTDIAQAVLKEVHRLGGRCRVAVLPHGPLTIPYLKPEGSERDRDEG